MIVRIPQELSHPSFRSKLAYVNTDCIQTVRTKWLEEDIDGDPVQILEGAEIHFTDGSTHNVGKKQWEQIEHYLELLQLKETLKLVGETKR